MPREANFPIKKHPQPSAVAIDRKEADEGRMPIFKLEPITDQRASPSWEATSLGEVCWIDARSEDDARTTVEGETLRMVDRRPGQPMTVF